MKWKTINNGLRKTILWSIGGLLLFTSIGFVETRQQSVQINKIDIRIHDQFEHFFLDEKDILLLMTDGGMEPVMGAMYQDTDLKLLEERVETHKFIRYAEVSKDLQGNLRVDAWQAQPIARIVRPDGVDAYISAEGIILPVLDRYTARTVLISGGLAAELMKEDMSKDHFPELLELLQYLDENEFWRAQIAQMSIDQNQDITMYPQVSKQLIEFGQPTDIETKLNKLKIFYQRILPVKGWNAYSRVNLKYQDQIICE
ncbi:MAG TPA: cell division protein FtsQ [Cytophagales bacterium]|nr:cell division protein FtsQ [Cytophagales bacterium]